VFAEPFRSNGYLFWLHNFGFQQACHNIFNPQGYLDKVQLTAVRGANGIYIKQYLCLLVFKWN
jgi:hypothetical protein